jgi:hypothetical protein
MPSLITCKLRAVHPEETAGRVTPQIRTNFIPRVAYHLNGFAGFLKLIALKIVARERDARATAGGTPTPHPSTVG